MFMGNSPLMSWGGASIQSMSDRSNDYRVALRYIVKGLLCIRLRRILSYLRVLVQLLELDDDVLTLMAIQVALKLIVVMVSPLSSPPPPSTP